MNIIEHSPTFPLMGPLGKCSAPYIPNNSLIWTVNAYESFRNINCLLEMHQSLDFHSLQTYFIRGKLYNLHKLIKQRTYLSRRIFAKSALLSIDRRVLKYPTNDQSDRQYKYCFCSTLHLHLFCVFSCSFTLGPRFAEMFTKLAHTQ